MYIDRTWLKRGRFFLRYTDKLVLRKIRVISGTDVDFGLIEKGSVSCTEIPIALVKERNVLSHVQR
jgi:hypothetical protein